ncbi:MAG: DUF3380 domain-containing protein [Methylophaga sp.]|nr:DUF3380 domain-containing protein [Methylophaga sp.]
MNHIGTGKRLNSSDIGKAAKTLGVDTAVLLAFLEVESAGKGFTSLNQVKILPEAHIFYRYLPQNLKAQAIKIGIALKKWIPGNYRFNKYKRFQRMIDFNEQAAYTSVSYGLGQIMGFNHKAAGHRTAKEMYLAAQQGEYEQLIQLVNLMKSWGLNKTLVNKDFTNPLSWYPAAKRYNGSGFKKNGYAKKLARAYKKHISKSNNLGHDISYHVSTLLKLGSKGEAVRNLQLDLQELGYIFVHGIDGRFGVETDNHLRNYQENSELKVDGYAGDKTIAAIKKDVAELSANKLPTNKTLNNQLNWLELITLLIKSIMKVFFK